MKEHLFTIPVNDAFRSDCECPVCALHRELEQNAIEYTMGPSYMEDDNRAQTDKLGFCQHHIQMLYQQKNRLGLALMLKTHTDKTIRDLKELPIFRSWNSTALSVSAWKIVFTAISIRFSICGKKMKTSVLPWQTARGSVPIIMVSSIRPVQTNWINSSIVPFWTV